jgi:hypothetical protein
VVELDDDLGAELFGECGQRIGDPWRHRVRPAIVHRTTLTGLPFVTEPERVVTSDQIVADGGRRPAGPPSRAR